jgi:hypothetical protein
MPASNVSMLFTWAIESVLISLIYLVLVDDYKTRSLLIASSITLAFHVACAALCLDSHYAVSISYLCFVTGQLISSLTVELNTMAPIISLVMIGITELVAVGMVFASTQSATSLFFYSRGQFALGVCVLLESTRCWSQNLGLILIMAFVASQLAPFDIVSAIFNFVALAGFATMLFIEGKMTAFYVIAALAALSLLWLLGLLLLFAVPSLPNMFLEVPLPGLPKFEGIQIGALTISPGPWLETLVFLVFFGTSAGVGIWQFTEGSPTFLYVIVAPLVLSILWIVSVWLWRPTSEQPSAPTLENIQAVKMRWPRVKIAVKEV